jgi:hypothetical protein
LSVLVNSSSNYFKNSDLMKKFVFTILMVLINSACTVAPPVELIPTDTQAEPTATVTPTVVWFPPTATPTAFPTPVVTPTEDMRPTLGRVLFKDDFSDANAWTTSQSAEGSVALGKNELTIAIGETNAYLCGVREEPAFSDFYLEITANTSLCRGMDEYGVLFRVSSAMDYYRFSLSCNGQVRLDRLANSQASSPQPWMMSGAVPPGAPSSARIGVAAQGEELSFFVNGRYQFSIHDPLLSAGGVGVFARSANKMAVTVNFSQLVIYEIIP